ncbi:MAG: YHYH protein [Saprospiraceae bacterium]|nr:YHYH protein [Saprospiraceae bacterium]
MKKSLAFAVLFALACCLSAQTNPAVTSWLINQTGLLGRHYVQGNSTPIQDNVSANVQSVQYSADWVYVQASGIPAYITGPFLDGNPSLATAQTGYFKIPLKPVQNTGTPTATTGGNIGAFINGVALFDYRDGVAWNPNTNALCGGPGNPPCPGGMGTAQAWNRDAIRAERAGFDCAKGHPAMGNYHHHQNPSAFNLDLKVISNVCDLYLADGLYTIDSTKHSPLIGFAYDGFPIYGAYGYKNTDGTGGIVRIRSGYHLRAITARTHHADGTDVADGPAVNATYPLGYFREDYEYLPDAAPDVLDVHNGRFCITPEYPQGIYAYFCTVDADWNSAYPYAVGPTFYGTRSASKVQTIGEPTTVYNPTTAVPELSAGLKTRIYPNPASDFIAVQAEGLLREKLVVRLFDVSGRLMQEIEIQPGSTIGFFDCRTLYEGVYLVSFEANGLPTVCEQVVVRRD